MHSSIIFLENVFDTTVANSSNILLCVLAPGFDRVSEGKAVSGKAAPTRNEQAQPGAPASQDAPQCPAGPG